MDSYILNTNNILPIKLPVISRPKFLMCWNIVNFFGELITSEEGCIMTSTESDKTGFYYSQWKQFHSYINTYDITMIGTKNQCNYLRDLVKSYKMIMGRVSDCITYIEVNDKNDVEKELNKLINKNAKFDVCLMNPPYGSKTKGQNPYLHLDFTSKTLEIVNDTLICIMPHRCVYANTSKYDSYKEIFDKSLTEVIEVSSDVFNCTNMADIGIFTFNKHKNESDNITLRFKSGEVNMVKSLFDISVFTSYEAEFTKYLKANKTNYNYFQPKGEYKDPDKKMSIYFNRWSKKFVHDIFMIASVANGAQNARYFSGVNGVICNNINELYNYLCETCGAVCNIMEFTSVLAAENCKVALQNPVLRFCLSKLQYDQSMTERVYQYVPSIDWSDPRVVTDEGLLEVCGCPKDKCKEYAEYCRKYMEEFDKQHQSKKNKKK